MSRQKVKIDQLWVPGGTPNGHVPTVNAGELAYAAGGVQSIVAGANVIVDSTDPAHPIVSATASDSASGRPLVMPRGTLQRKYTFDADTQGWVAATGTLSWDSTRATLKHVASAVSATQVILEPSAAASVADGELVVDLSEVSGNTANAFDTGAFFRATDASNLYMLALRLGTNASPSVELFKCVAGAFTSLGGSVGSGNNRTSRDPLNGIINARLLVRFIGGHIRAYLNEQFIGAWNDTTFTTGRIGVRGFANTSGMATFWDNAVVYSLPSGWKQPTYD